MPLFLPNQATSTIVSNTKAFLINARDFGTVGDGIHDDTTALQNALNAVAPPTPYSPLPGNTLYIPFGTYLVSKTLLFYGNTKIFGAGSSSGGTTIQAAPGLSTPILASYGWYNNNTVADYPVEISDLQLSGNGTMTGSNGHGLVVMNFWSIIEQILITGVSGVGLMLSAQTQNNIHITNTCNEAKIIRVQVRNSGGRGIFIQDNGTPLNSCTDGFLEDCIVQNAGDRGIDFQCSSGWLVQGNHVYGTVRDAFKFDQCYATRVTGNYVDEFGSGSSSGISGIVMNILDGRGSSCIGNHIGFENGVAAGPYYGININGQGSSSLSAVAIIHGNTVNGGNQSGSIGYLLQTNSSSLWKAYFVQNDFKNVATGVTYVSDVDVVGGDLATLGHIGCISTRLPTAAAGANAGSSPPVPVRNNCTDVAGNITFGTGTSPAAGAMVVLTFAVAYGTAPKVTVTPINSASAALNFYVTSTTTTFTVSCVTAPSASQGNTIYGFNYHVFL
jgi:hypothetical protein